MLLTKTETKGLKSKPFKHFFRDQHYFIRIKSCLICRILCTVTIYLF